MTQRIKKLLERLNKREYRNHRKPGITVDTEPWFDLESQAECFKKVADEEKPLIFDGDSFGFNRYTDFRGGIRGGNVTIDYGRVLENGLDMYVSDIKKALDGTDDEDKKIYGKAMLELVEVCIDIGDRYRDFAEKCGNTRLYNALLKIPRRGADSFYEALVFIKFLIYVLRLYGVSHLTLGRFDQYMYSFYTNDKKRGITDDAIFELLEEFFISLNYDTDLYMGIQQGDNGQSMVLGGFEPGGKSVYNELSQMCIEASLELSVIDPKINLRVGRGTPDEIYEFATLLTKQGLGFPQYCNDDVVVPGLVKLGYKKEDAENYTVAACWEYIIPGKGADIPNLGTMDFPGVVNNVIMAELSGCETFDELMGCVRDGISEECTGIIEKNKAVVFGYEPLLSVFMDGCISKLTDMWYGGTEYLNFGCHGAGIANAADALAAVKFCVFDEKYISKQALIDALNANFEGYAEIRNMLKNSPKMGNNDEYADSLGYLLMEMFSGSMNGRDNGHGGIWRAGTGSAMEYIWKGEACPATADGRYAGEPYASSFSPSLDVKPSGLLSVIQSFTGFDMTKIINGGPLTIEIHDTVFRNDTGVKKTAMLVKNYIMLGGHQLQLNTINRERLLDAQKNPEKYPDLIVRVWGWSGYFNELDIKYQNHIIRRCEFTKV